MKVNEGGICVICLKMERLKCVVGVAARINYFDFVRWKTLKHVFFLAADDYA